MGLTRASLRKWAREIFPSDGAPLVFEAEGAETRLLARLAAEVEGREGLSARASSRHYHDGHPRAGWREFAELIIADPARRYGGECFGLELDPEHRLFVRVGYGYRGEPPRFPVSAEGQLERLVERAEEERAKAVLQGAKKDKRRMLELRALRARIEPVARSHDLAFAIETTATGAKIHFEWPGRRFGEIFVPWKQLGEAVETLDGLLVPLTRSLELGIRVRTKTSGGSYGRFLTWHRFDPSTPE